MLWVAWHFINPHPPPHHVINPPQFPSYSTLLGPPAHPLYIGKLSSVKIPSGTYHKVCNDFQHQQNQSLQNPYSELTPSPQHSTSTSSSTPLAHMSLSDGNTFVTINRFRTVCTTLDTLWLYILIFVTKKMYLRATTNIRQVSHMMLMWMI